MSFTISTESITKAIQGQITIAVEEVAAKHIDAAQAELAVAIRRRLPQIVMSLADAYEVMFERHAIVIRIKIEDKRT